MKNELLIKLHQQPQTVFTLKEASLLSTQDSYLRLKDKLSSLAQRRALKRLAKGIYAKQTYNPQELANKLYTPSYISLETVLRQAGVVFQYYDSIFSVSYLTRTVSIHGQQLIYRRLKKSILFNPQGINRQGLIQQASPERAFLDAVYLYKNYHFDNLSGLDWPKILTLRKIYQNQTFSRRVANYYHLAQEENAQ